MKKLDQRGVAAFEFTLVAVPLFTLMFVIIDLGRYMITQQSLNALANAEARATMISCITPDKQSGASPSTCTQSGGYLSTTNMQSAAPFLYAGGLTPSVSIVSSGTDCHGNSTSFLKITTTLNGFNMLTPLMGTFFTAAPVAPRKPLLPPTACTMLPY